MEMIQSFRINHDVLMPGIYVSRIDGDITTYDLRTRRPNMGDYMDLVTMHSVEHMIATFIRNSDLGPDVIYFGPMGCQTGFYLLVRNADNLRVFNTLKDCLKKTVEHTGDVFGKSAVECGNYKCLDIDAAKIECRRYLDALEAVGTPDFKYKE